MSDSLMTPDWVYRACENRWHRPALDPCFHWESFIRPKNAHCLVDNWHPSSPKAIVYPGKQSIVSYVDEDGKRQERPDYEKFYVVWQGQDGLAASWSRWCEDRKDWVWLNPPYSNVTPWLKKAHEEEVPFVALLKFDPTTKWYDNYIRPYQHSGDFQVGIFRERLRYERTDGGKQASAEFPSFLFYPSYMEPGPDLKLDYLADTQEVY